MRSFKWQKTASKTELRGPRGGIYGSDKAYVVGLKGCWAPKCRVSGGLWGVVGGVLVHVDSLWPKESE